MNEKRCNCCPRACNILRTQTTGRCGQSDAIRVARIAPHFWEEPPISGQNGSGAIFFVGCNLRCCFCQNAEISRNQTGAILSAEELYTRILCLAKQGVHNINLVTPSHYTMQLLSVLKALRQSNFQLPIIWNSSAYETVATLRELEGLVDVFLPDFKFWRLETAKQYADAPDYPQIAKAALAEMVRQVGSPQYQPQTGQMVRGVQVRHLVLPGHAQESRQILWYLHQTYGDQIGISLMNQYTPMPQVAGDPLLSRTVTPHEYEGVVRYAQQIGISNAFIQESESASAQFIPHFSTNL